MYLNDKGLDSLYKLAKNGTAGSRRHGTASQSSGGGEECKVTDVTLNGSSLVENKVARLDSVAAEVELQLTTEEETEVSIDVEDDSYTKEEEDEKFAALESKFSSLWKIQGQCTEDELPTEGMELNDVWVITENGTNFKQGDEVYWNGSAWSLVGQQVDLAPYALKTSVEAEEERAKAAEEANAEAVADEATARSEADTALQGNIDKKADADALTAETTARTEADTALQNSIDTATAAAEIAVQVEEAVEIRVDVETGAYTKDETDALLAVKADADDLTAEETARTDADTALQGSIDKKADADDLTAEATARSEADTALQNSIDTATAAAEIAVQVEEAVEIRVEAEVEEEIKTVSYTGHDTKATAYTVGGEKILNTVGMYDTDFFVILPIFETGARDNVININATSTLEVYDERTDTLLYANYYDETSVLQFVYEYDDSEEVDAMRWYFAGVINRIQGPKTLNSSVKAYQARANDRFILKAVGYGFSFTSDGMAVGDRITAYVPPTSSIYISCFCRKHLLTGSSYSSSTSQTFDGFVSGSYIEAAGGVEEDLSVRQDGERREAESSDLQLGNLRAALAESTTQSTLAISCSVGTAVYINTVQVVRLSPGTHALTWGGDYFVLDD